MKPISKPLQITIYQDVLCTWCYLADLRLDTVRLEFGDSVRWTVRPYPLRIHDVLPTAREVKTLSNEIQRARSEPDAAARALSTDLWTAGDPPRTSLPALAALEAAHLQGSAARAFLARAMQRAALEQGINVTRSDVIFELASRVGLRMNAFTAAYTSAQTQRLILQEHKVASSRGIRGVPALVVGGRWMLCGLRETSEYREHILWCMSQLGVRRRSGEPERTLH